MAGEQPYRVLVSIVTFNSGPLVAETLRSLRSQSFSDSSIELSIVVFDNGSLLDYREWLEELCARESVRFATSPSNLGFSAAHNCQAYQVVNENFDALLVLNPDVFLEENCIEVLVRCIFRSTDPSVQAYVPLLLKSNSELTPLVPEQVDSAGITFTSDLRHFDRFQNKLVSELDLREEEVPGGTGACLLITKDFIEQVSFRGARDQEGVQSLYPQLMEGSETRLQVFDEAFFAYREDAELALRAQRLGLRAVFIPQARAFHVRRVTPEKRVALSSDINALGVRNRFLLQLLHYRPFRAPLRCLRGFVWRNLLVLVGIFTVEQSSMRALREVWLLRKRCLERNRMLEQRGASLSRIWRWYA
ncbi:MAG: glycosyltransferase family 2 protein [Bdellovibrionales bacterium]|nr:glycosyltransferase family 2 protein [Bdellovibrionales bacterium]